MLRELHISNLAVIEDAVVEFAPGLNVLTGPTGAGKSLVIGAIEILLGLRAPARLLRDGASEGRVTGIFDLAGTAIKPELAALTDMRIDEDELLVTRRALASGRTTASVNGQPAPAAALKALGERLIDIHGQHDQQFLLRPVNQLSLLDDRVAGPLREATRTAFCAWREAAARRDALRADARQRQERIELLEFQSREIDDAAPRAGELEAVEARHRLVSRIDQLRATLSSVAAALVEGDSPPGDSLARLAARLLEAAGIDAQVKPWADSLSSAALIARETARDLSTHAESLDADPAELAALDARLAALRRLASRYGPTIEDVLRRREEMSGELAALRLAADESASMDQLVAQREAEYRRCAAALSAARRRAAAALVPAVSSQLAELGLERALFDIDLREAEPAATGMDAVEFVVRTNPGQPMRSLREIASGGEMNRLMLALKSVAADIDRCSVLVFDEVDANVGGRMGSVIGRKLRGLAGRHQVLCITHLPQIAAYADQHLRVEKIQSARETRTVVKCLSYEERVAELAEMIAGKSVSETTRGQARDLLSEAAAHRGVQKKVVVASRPIRKCVDERGAAAVRSSRLKTRKHTGGRPDHG